MNYVPSESALIQHEFVLTERAKHVANVLKNNEKKVEQKPYVPKKATRKQMAEMRDWGVKKV